MPDARTGLIAGAVLALIAVQPVQAQNAAPADSQTIAGCLKKADGEGQLGGNCIGAVADPCIRNADNDAGKSRACAARELNVWTGIAAAAAKKVQAGGFKDINAALLESEKGWTQLRDKLCPAFDKIDPGMMPGNAVYCRMQTTAHRALLLRRLADAVSEH
jgi:hypothetical protein